MRLRHMNDRHSDFPTQIDALSRETTEMLLATLNSAPNGEELYLGVLNAVELDWNDKTHNVCTEFIQSSELGIPDCTRLTIAVTNVTEPIDSIDPIDGNDKRIETALTVSALLGHLHTEYHIRYIPVDWSLSMMKTVENDFQKRGGVGWVEVTTPPPADLNYCPLSTLDRNRNNDRKNHHHGDRTVPRRNVHPQPRLQAS